jgi:hypothetical protein
MDLIDKYKFTAMLKGVAGAAHALVASHDGIRDTLGLRLR